MQTDTKDMMEAYLKMSLPHVNWKLFWLAWVATSKYEWPLNDTFTKQMTITIEERADYKEDMDPQLRYAHGCIERSFDDRPIRDHALTIIVRKKRWRHKETGEVRTSKESWLILYAGTSRAEDQLWFLK